MNHARDHELLEAGTWGPMFVVRNFFEKLDTWNLDLQGQVGTVPEPSSLALLVCGTLGLSVFGYRRRTTVV